LKKARYTGAAAREEEDTKQLNPILIYAHTLVRLQQLSSNKTMMVNRLVFATINSGEGFDLNQRIAMDEGMTTKHLTHQINTRVTTYVS
jgi:hypothetical protein